MRLFKLLILLLACTTAFAQPRLPKNYYWQKLDNDLEVVVVENSKVPLVTIEMAVKNGAYTEGAEYSGLSHLFEHMFFKANKDYPNQEKFLKRTQELGAIWNGTTGAERVNYYFTIHKDSMPAGIKFMNAAMRFPIYRKEDMEKERPVVDGEFQRAESNPNFILSYECQKRLWGDLMTRKNPIGDHDIINTATPEKMMVIKDRYYHPDNSLLVIVGDVKHEAAFANAKKVFGDWKPSGINIFQKYPIPEFKPLAGTQYFVKESSIATTPTIHFWWHGPDYRHDSVGTLAADVFSTLLRLNSSKWSQSLVNAGLATFTAANYSPLKYVGPILIGVLPNPPKLKECYAEVMNQFNMWGGDDYFTDEQLADAKQVLLRAEIRKNEKPSSAASQVSYNWCSTSLDYATDYNQNLQKISKRDINNYINKYIKGKPFVAGMIINPEMNKQLQPTTFFKPTI